jgi:hypothetical protein
MRVFYTPYDNDNPPKHVLDPRGWEQTSDIIYSNNGELRLELLANKVGSNIAQNILAFAKQPVITVEDIVSGEIDASAIPKAYDAKYSMAMRLRNATEEELAPVRAFVKEFLGDEMLSVYDATWVGKDKDRAIFLEELKKQPMGEFVDAEKNQEDTLKKYPKNVLIKGLSYPTCITNVEEFWENPGAGGTYKYIKCKEEWQADVLMYVFNKMGKKWNSGEPYSVGKSYWLGKSEEPEERCYSNDGFQGEEQDFDKRISHIRYFGYDFDDVNYGVVASDEEIIAALCKDAEFAMSVEDFWHTEAEICIHCPEEWQANILTKVFDRMGRMTRGQNTYTEGTDWESFEEEAVYDNKGYYGERYFYGSAIVYHFEDVDLSKYLSDEEIKEIQNKMPGTAYDNIKVM